MRRTIIAPVLAALALAGAACAEEPAPTPTLDVPETGGALTAEQLLAASNAFGPSLLAADPDAVNAVVSPASLTLALASLGAGSSGTAAAEFDAVLGSHGEPLLQAASDLAGTLQAYEGEPAVDPEEPPATPLVHIADHLVLDDQLQAEQTYLDMLETIGGAELSHTDFGDADAATALLDEWVNHHTAGLIEQSAIEPTADMRLVVQNAVLFSARWESEFEATSTMPYPFTLPDGSTVDADAMADTRYVALAEVDGWEAISLPYTEGFHTVVILPPEGEDPLDGDPTAISATIDELKALLEDAEQENTYVRLPVLELATALDLKGSLTDAGLGSIFDENAQSFLGISTAEELFVSQAAQQGVLIMNEAGTTAAAVTEFGMEATSAPAPEEPREFIVDRPYLLTITASEGGWDLFQAVVRDPTAAE